MQIHILGICGTFMGGLAALARAAGHQVSGSDQNVYPPMSTQLQGLGIRLFEGYAPAHLDPAPDMVVIGNALSRGNPAVEHVLDRGLPYTSGPQWLAEHVLAQRWVLAVAGTHGKTSTTSMLAWILEHAGLDPGFLVGGVPADFGTSARLGSTPFFVVEADEYDTAFFDKRSKFVHYHPRTAILNNLEFDHADIFPDLAAIQRQFHHLVRTIPESGLIVAHGADANLDAALAMGCWTPVERFGADGARWQAVLHAEDGSDFDVLCEGAVMGRVQWQCLGRHNVDNALAAVAAARHAGVPPAEACAALRVFKGVRRRMEVRGVVDGVTVYDDFAHHPTAIRTTIAGLRRRVGDARIIAVLEPRSNTMKLGVHRGHLLPSLEQADRILVYRDAGTGWDVSAEFAPGGDRAEVLDDIGALVHRIAQQAVPGDHVLIMSNGGFGGIHGKVLEALSKRK